MFTIQGLESLEEIHQSDYSIVYRGKETATQKTVAVKVLKEEFPSSHNIARFNEEYEITNKYDIAGIRKVLAKQKLQNRPVLIMEYLEGIPLKKLIEDKKFDVALFLRTAIEITTILEEIHQHNIIHKDINPKNIIVLGDGNIKMIDFGIASVIKKEVKQLSAPSVLEGTLSYISPEQTGRMNRSVDYRTDLYSLGVTFYEMLTGQLPFSATDAMEIVHCHIAKAPVPPVEVNSSIPKILSDIIIKLLAKNAEDRYQSAFGLRTDLQQCLDQLTKNGKITEFPLAKQDVADQFHIPEKLYGREKERQELLAAFNRISKGAIELILVGGYSGIGKTAIINEVHKPITEKKGYFISGKFEQFQRDVPYSAILHALKDFVNQLLAESPERIAKWKEKILGIVGKNGRVITDVVPNMEVIIGPQPELEELGPIETQTRFNIIFKRFISDMSQAEHPLVIFIDDWQWADSASLNFLKLIITDFENQYLMVIGAYRDNEVDNTHPFITTLEGIKKAGAIVSTLNLQPLQKDQVNELIADTLNTDLEAPRELSELIYSKTGGNPFFVNQFFKSLYEEKHIRFDYSERVWKWDTSAIQQLNITNNIVELMVSKIQKLSPATQHALQLGACIGNTFSLSILAHISQKTIQAMVGDLREALDEGLVLPINGNYYSIDETIADTDISFKFLHDRVEQATYSMISESEKKQQHLRIGRLILSQSRGNQVDEDLFNLVKYLNSAKDLITDARERAQLVDLNLRAAQRAKKSVAYQPALNYIQTAIALLDQNSWTTDYEATYNIYREYAECSYLAADIETAQQVIEVLLENTRSIVEKAQSYLLQVKLFENTSKFTEAIEAGKKGLKLLGVIIPDTKQEQDEAIERELVQINEKLEGREIESIIDQPAMVNQEMKIAVSILLSLDTACQMTGQTGVLLLAAVKGVAISLTYGNVAAFPYMSYGIFLATALGKVSEGNRFGQVALRINQKMNNVHFRGLLYLHYAMSLNFRSNSIRQGLELFKQGVILAKDNGDMVNAAYCASVGTQHAIISGMDLNLIHEEYSPYLTFLSQQKNQAVYDIVSNYLSWSYNFRGITQAPLSLSHAGFDEEGYKNAYFAVPILEASFGMTKISVLIRRGAYQEAAKLALRLEEVDGAAGVQLMYFYMCFCYGIAFVKAAQQTSDAEEKELFLSKAKTYRDKYHKWASDAHHNFKHKLDLIGAEIARLEGRITDAMDLFDEAIKGARENEFYNNEGLACELAAQFYLSLNKKNIARVYIAEAQYAYKMWGADGLLNYLETTYPDLLSKSGKSRTMSDSVSHSAHTANTSTTKSVGLDFQSIMKASQAISKEIRLESLLQSMMRILMENAGAEKSFFIQSKDGKLVMTAGGRAGDREISILEKQPVKGNQELPSSLIYYVERTKETIVLDNAARDKRFAQDHYIQENKVKSVLCVPVIHQGELKAIIYMENNLTSGAFTPERVGVINMLSGQISTSIANAEVYEHLEQIVAERTQELVGKNEELHEKNLRITDSIRYAQRIQKAILPTDRHLREVFSDYFIIYKPKDIVSGDFYWLKTTEDHKAFIAAVDCTGHGVPGAFMSMIGNTLLDEIVSSKKGQDPASVLEQLDVMIKQGLRQAETDNIDGMDLCVCMLEYIDANHTKVTFSGAKRPVYYTQNGQLLQLDADRRAIGGMFSSAKGNFTNQTVVLPKGSILYLSTDGFADQANSLRKSLGTKTLKEMIEANLNLDMEAQKSVYEGRLAEHQQDTPQRDDITLLGIKL